MKKYIGTKTVSATSAWRIDGIVYLKDDVVPRSMNREDGYKVVGEDGCESWFPKDVFEKEYLVAETLEDRMVIELKELTDKADKLNAFLCSDKFTALSPAISSLLKAQYNIMCAYIQALKIRLDIMQGQEQAFEHYSFNFGTAMGLLEAGFVLRRRIWNGTGLCVIKQVPAHITEVSIPHMQSLPQQAKDLIMRGAKCIDYTSQCLIYNTKSGRADSWVPSIVDIFAVDWEVVL